MQFDWPTDEDFRPEQPSTSADEKDRPMVADGRHTATIRWAGEQAQEWAKHDDNPTGKVLTIKLDFGPQWRPVWESVRAHWRGAIEAVCRCAGVAAPVSGTPWSESELVGRHVVVDTVQAIAKSGREYVRIEKWHVGPPVVELPKVERRTLPQKAAAEVRANGGADGDFPF